MKVVAITAGILLALVPSGTAFAGEGPQGNAWGNCKHSSAGGVHVASGFAGNGNGGMSKIAKVSGDCSTAPVVEDEQPPTPPAPPESVLEF
jgi:hypothetical protein